jgi:hypothetical protein
MRRSLLLFVPLMLVGSLFGCKKATEVLEEESNTMTAIVGGQNFEGVTNIAKYFKQDSTQPAWLAISSKRGASSIALNIDTAAMAGTFVIDSGALTPAANAYYSPDATEGYRAYRGSIILESKTADRVKGSFAFTLLKVGGTPSDTVVVSNGKFNMSYIPKF